MYPRFAERQVRDALADTRTVLISGPRQAGKTTLAEKFIRQDMPFLTLDDETTLDAARRDPVALVRGLDRAIIDEVQREPRLILAIKRSVDTDRRPGRFILTGSAKLMTLPQVADSLAGRMSVTELLPLSQSEVHGKPCDFLDRVFQGRTPAIGPIVLADDLVELVSRGGYPEALERTSWARRQKWLLDYSKAIIERDVQHIAKVDHLRHMPKLLRLLAEHSAQLINFSGLGAPLGLSHHTTQKYTGILEQLFLVRSLQPWYHNAIKKIVKTPKLHFLDSGLLAALRNLSPEKLKSGRAQFGALLETFVLAELLKLASWSGRHLQIFHYRDRNDDEVDIVIEDPEGRVVGRSKRARRRAAGFFRAAEARGNLRKQIHFRVGSVRSRHRSTVCRKNVCGTHLQLVGIGAARVMAVGTPWSMGQKRTLIRTDLQCVGCERECRMANEYQWADRRPWRGRRARAAHRTPFIRPCGCQSGCAQALPKRAAGGKAAKSLPSMVTGSTPISQRRCSHIGASSPREPWSR